MTERFELLTELGRGGMGTVWKARDTESGALVALKLLHEMYVSDEDYVKRFEREVDIARRIDSPHVVKVLGFGRQDGRPYVAMEYVSGRSLKDLLKERGKLDPVDAQRLFEQLIVGLEDAHRAGVLHRDIKPGNLLIDETGRLKITDFGISRAADLTRMTGSVTVLGTPTYMAPEGQVDERSELYSAGCVYYEMLGGRPPFEGDSMHAVILKHLREQPDLGRLPVAARVLIGKLLEKEPNARPASVAEVVRELLPKLPEEGSRVRPREPITQPAARSPARNETPSVVRVVESRAIRPAGRSPAIAAAFLGNGDDLILAYLDGTISIWSAAGGSHRLVRADYGAGAVCFAMSRSSMLFAAGLADGGVTVWALPAFRVVAHLEGMSPSLVSAVDFSPDGTKVAAVTWDGRAQLWTFGSVPPSAAFGSAKRRTTSAFQVLPSQALKVARFDAGGSRVILADSRTTWRWDPFKADSLEVIGDSGAMAVDVAPDGAMLIADPNETVMVKQAGSRTPFDVVAAGAPVTSVAFAPDATTYAYTSGDTVTIRASRPTATASRAPLATIRHSSQVKSMAFNRSGNHLATVDEQGVARIWELQP